MSDAVLPSLGIVAYLALFAAVGIVFLLANLVLGWFIRPSNPHAEKLEIYECGEPAVGSAFMQFDLRFYVVALLFIIFDVEVAFFFPWATVFGKATHLADFADPTVAVATADEQGAQQQAMIGLYQEMGIQRPELPRIAPLSLRDAVRDDELPETQQRAIIRAGAKQFALVTIVDIAVFFAILLIGFAYVWKRGDLNWVRAYRGERAGAVSGVAAADEPDLDQALSA